MSDFRIIHRTFLKKDSDESTLVWSTCLRKIYFSDASEELKFRPQKGDEIYVGLEAQSFLAEVLCGLRSPLVGETEVFGQFKVWWKSLPEGNQFRLKFQSQIENLFALVKTVREKALCGHGSQSYGSLLRKNLVPGQAVDIIGAGHLTQEILPWLKNKSTHRIWCRNLEKVKNEIGYDSVISMNDRDPLSTVVVIAAPLSHEDLNSFLKERNFTAKHKIFDFRADSADFVPFVKPEVHLKLKDFSTKFDIHQHEIEKSAQAARDLIRRWKEVQEAKAVVRPYGWDDL